MSNYAPPPKFDPHFSARVDLRGQNVTNLNVNSTFQFNFYIHYKAIMYRLATIHNVADRQMTDGSEYAAYQYAKSKDLEVLNSTNTTKLMQ